MHRIGTGQIQLIESVQCLDEVLIMLPSYVCFQVCTTTESHHIAYLLFLPGALISIGNFPASSPWASGGSGWPVWWRQVHHCQPN